MSKKAVIAGAGPAGLTCSLYLARAGWDVTVLSDEESTESCLVEANIVQNYPGFPDGISGMELLELFRSQAEGAGVTMRPEGASKVLTDERVVVCTDGSKLEYDEYVEAVGCTRREFMCTGLNKVRTHYCAVCDGSLYGKDDHVLVIGGGDTAVSSALYLSGIAGRVTMIVRKSSCRATNRMALEELSSKGNVVIMYETQLYCVSTENRDSNPVLHLACGRRPDVLLTDVKGVFVCIGHDVNSVEHVGNGRTWKCGDCSNNKKQVAIAVGDGAGVAMDIIGA